MKISSNGLQSQMSGFLDYMPASIEQDIARAKIIGTVGYATLLGLMIAIYMKVRK